MPDKGWPPKLPGALSTRRPDLRKNWIHGINGQVAPVAAFTTCCAPMIEEGEIPAERKKPLSLQVSAGHSEREL